MGRGAAVEARLQLLAAGADARVEVEGRPAAGRAHGDVGDQLRLPWHADEPRYGLLEPDGRTRQAGVAFERLAATVAGADSWEGVAGGDLAGVAIGRGRSSALVVWSQRGAALRLRPQRGGRAERVTGGQVPWGHGGLEVGPQPLLITLPATADGAEALERAR